MKKYPACKELRTASHDLLGLQHQGENDKDEAKMLLKTGACLKKANQPKKLLEFVISICQIKFER